MLFPVQFTLRLSLSFHFSVPQQIEILVIVSQEKGKFRFVENSCFTHEIWENSQWRSYFALSLVILLVKIVILHTRSGVEKQEILSEIVTSHQSFTFENSYFTLHVTESQGWLLLDRPKDHDWRWSTFEVFQKLVISSTRSYTHYQE